MKNVKFRGKKTHCTAKRRIPRLKFCGKNPNSAGRGKLWALIICMYTGNVSVFLSVPVLDQCLQTAPTPVFGPLWVSKGEGFSPRGVIEFLTRLITCTKGKLKEAKDYKRQVVEP